MMLFQDFAKVLQDDDVICTDRYLDHTKACSLCTYCKRDLMYRGGNWREKRHKSLLQVQPTENLVIGHSDNYTSRLDLGLMRFIGFERVFGVNLKPVKHFSAPLPLGLTNNTSESKYHRLFGNHRLLLQAKSLSSHPIEYRGTIVGNFSVETNPKVRLPLARLLEASFETFELPDFSLDGRLRYLTKVAESNFVACPEGNGIDTHRLWETLYMGSVPIIRRNESLEPLLDKLPVLIVDKWSQIQNKSFLEEAWNDIVSVRDHDFSWLRVSRWLQFLHPRDWGNQT